MKTYSKIFLLFLIDCLTIANLFEHGVAASRETNVSGVSQQQQYEHGFVAGYMQAYIDVCGNFDTIIPSIPKPDDGATSYADGYVISKMQGQKDGDDNCLSRGRLIAKVDHLRFPASLPFRCIAWIMVT